MSALLSSTLFPYTTLFRSDLFRTGPRKGKSFLELVAGRYLLDLREPDLSKRVKILRLVWFLYMLCFLAALLLLDRKSTRLNSSHRTISYAVFCLKKKNTLS